MNPILKEACDKMDACTKHFKDKYADAIAEPVKETLKEFCRQQEEFARAVIDGDVEQCILSVSKKISGKRAVSDLEVYQAAVEYFFPGAKVEFKMLIHMSEYDIESAPDPVSEQPKKSLDLSLDSLIDW